MKRSTTREAKPRYRITQWLNTKTMEPVFGIQRQATDATWANCAIDGKPLLYNNAETAQKHLRWLRDPKGTAHEWGAKTDV